MIKYTYDGWDVIRENSSLKGVTTYQNGLGIDDKLRSKNGNTVRYFLTDHLGSTGALADASGTIVSSTSYDSFGNATKSIPTSYQYTGREYDPETGLYYYRSRWYDPEIGRFTSKDPIGFAGGDINLYGYVGNKPLSFTDPFGNYACESQKRKRQQDEKCDLVAASFDELKNRNPHALALLNATYGEYRARVEYIGWTTYLKAVFLNTTAAVGDAGLDLSKARFENFYNGDKGVRAYGIIVSGFTGIDLDNVGLNKKIDILGIKYGRRSPRNIKEGSVEATLEGDKVIFDIDLYNPYSNPIDHGLEVLGNAINKKSTHPAEVVEKLKNRGVLTGVTCKNGK